mmetsp:Transcript_11683/g.24134  ORF Transcript_11683/g.24134 Transcript_11683/m.24134 type:complete len:231 (+) Transcript_11683:400-1092(+)
MIFRAPDVGPPRVLEHGVHLGGGEEHTEHQLRRVDPQVAVLSHARKRGCEVEHEQCGLHDSRCVVEHHCSDRQQPRSRREHTRVPLAVRKEQEEAELEGGEVVEEHVELRREDVARRKRDGGGCKPGQVVCDEHAVEGALEPHHRVDHVQRAVDRPHHRRQRPPLAHGLVEAAREQHVERRRGVGRELEQVDQPDERVESDDRVEALDAVCPPAILPPAPEHRGAQGQCN